MWLRMAVPCLIYNDHLKFLNCTQKKNHLELKKKDLAIFERSFKT